ncbi:MAG: RtcB family protein [Candidatus Micrarchaeota archaeon]
MDPQEIYNLKKVSDAVWELPREGAMNVPVRIFASDLLIDKMRRDRTIKQARNVASLPGILEAAMVMPDGHEGYGFPIGGVAAFDLDTGVVSPGGVGYDINCLAAGSNVRHSLGFYLPIESFEMFFKNFNLIKEYSFSAASSDVEVSSLDINSHKFASKSVLAFMKKQADKRMLSVTTASGLNLLCSEDHPILTNRGMVKAGELIATDKIAMLMFQGVGFEPIKDFQRQGVLAKVLGYLFGDGSISNSKGKLRTAFYGAKGDLEVMQRDLVSLGVHSHIVERKRYHTIESQYGKKSFVGQCAELHVYSQSFANELISLGAPVGRKTSLAFSVPQWIKDSPLWLKRLFLAGFFGAELSSPATHSKTGFYSPILSQNKNVEFKEAGRTFLIDIMALLEDFGVKCTKIAERMEHENKQGKTMRLRLEISADEDNLLKLWRVVGFEYNTKRQQLGEIAAKYILSKQKLTQKRTQIAAKVNELKTKGLTLREVSSVLVCPEANTRFIERSYYEKVGQRITLDFISFKDFSVQCKKEFEQFGALLDEISEIKQIDYSGIVYDFTVADLHNFVANGIVVSNCGVRLLRTDLTEKEVRPKLKELILKMYDNIPSGVGSKSKMRLNDVEFEQAVTQGSRYFVEEKDIGVEGDLEHCEENGQKDGALYSKLSPMAIKRGKPQFGTLGSGNHFSEIQKVDKIYDVEAAKAFGITQEGQVTVMIHSGSRGFGHQVCEDSIRVMLPAAKKYGINLPDYELCCAPIKSPEAQDYFGAMNCAVNFAFGNRHCMGQWVRETFQQVFNKDWETMGMKTVYDVCHNIAKIEEHEVNGVNKKVCVHRKGATRAFWAGRKEIPAAYRNIGQPVIIPGSMSTASYLLVGIPSGRNTFGSTCHGAGRIMSRHQALRDFDGVQLQKDMESSGIQVKAPTPKSLAEEAGGAYKDIDEVINTVKTAKISNVVCRLVPIGVIKG